MVMTMMKTTMTTMMIDDDDDNRFFLIQHVESSESDRTAAFLYLLTYKFI